MPEFQYEAMDNTGLEIKDTIEAPSEAEAQQKIREKGLLRHQDPKTGQAKENEKSRRAKSRRRQKEGAVFLRRRETQKTLYVHPAALHAAGCRPADSALACEFWKARPNPARSKTR